MLPPEILTAPPPPIDTAPPEILTFPALPPPAIAPAVRLILPPDNPPVPLPATKEIPNLEFGLASTSRIPLGRFVPIPTLPKGSIRILSIGAKLDPGEVKKASAPEEY